MVPPKDNVIKVKKTLSEKIQVVWNGEGEWEITLRVFRDLGIAFGVALLGIFIVLRIQPVIPLSLPKMRQRLIIVSI